MSVSHHGAEQDPKQSEILKLLLDQFEQKAKREYSMGRIAPDDDGDLAFAVSADPAHQRIVIRFGKPVEWIGMPPAQAVKLAEILVNHARTVATQTGEVLTINL